MSTIDEKSSQLPITRFRKGSFSDGDDAVVRESTLTLFLNGRELVNLVCSPGEIKELAVGFLCSEGLLKKREDLKHIETCPEKGLARIELAEATPAGEKQLNHYLASGCGRGRTSFHFLKDTHGISPISSNLRTTPRELFSLSDELEKRSLLFIKTGGAHSAALCTRKEIIVYYEDIGRHNAVDKIFGHCFLEGISFVDKLLVFSGRISSEILSKIIKMGIPIIVSRSAPTELTVKLAQELGITVVGFAREGRLNIYTHPGRVTGGVNSL